MTPARVKIGLVAFLLLGVGLSGNLLFFQPNSRLAAPRGERGIATGAISRSDHAAEAVTFEAIRALQRELNLRGYEVGNPDGKRGLVTEAAIMAFEYDHGLALTAEPTEGLLMQVLMETTRPEPRRRASVELSASAELVVRKVQQQLAAAGYMGGKPTGRLDEDTVRAIREFEGDQRLPETGRVSGQLVAKLSLLKGKGK